MFYYSVNFILCLIFLIFIISASTTEEIKSNFIAFIARKLNKKFVFLLRENENSAKEKYECIGLQKTLYSTLNLYTSIIDMKSLAENLPKDSGEKFLIVFHLTEKSLQYIISISNKMTLPELTWLCLSYSSGMNSTAFSKAFIPFSTRFLYAFEEQGKMVINEIYQVTKDSPKLTNYYGTWGSNGRALLREDEEFWERRKNFGLASLRCLVKNLIPDPFHPCDAVNWYWEGDPALFECLFFNIWGELANAFNFTTNYTVFPVDKHKAYVDQVQEILLSKKVDGTVLPFIMTSSRLDYFDFMWPVSSSSLYVYSRVSQLEIKFSSYIEPFGFRLWMALLAWILGSTSLLLLIEFISTRFFMKRDFKFLRDATDHLIAPFSAICAQTCNVKDGILSLRILLVLIHILPLFLLPAYSGCLISSLAKPPLKVPFSNLEEFMSNGQYKFMALRDSFAKIYVLRDPNFERVRKRNLVLRENEMPLKDDTAFLRLCNKKLGLVSIQPVMLVRRPKCRIYAMDERFGNYFSTFPFPRGCPYLELFNRMLQKRMSSGIYLNDIRKLALDKMNVNLGVKNSRILWLNQEPYHNTKRPFTFHDILPLLTVYSCGVALSLSIFLLELQCKRSRKIKSEFTHSEHGIIRRITNK